MNQVACDTSTAIPLLVRSHPEHTVVRDHLSARRPVLTNQSLAETYSVLTRLPADARVTPQDAVRLIESTFGEPLCPDTRALSTLPRVLASVGVAGGAVYDALVALAARHGQVRSSPATRGRSEPTRRSASRSSSSRSCRSLMLSSDVSGTRSSLPAAMARPGNATAAAPRR